MIYLFDVDGTLTPSRKQIDKKFAIWFSKFCEHEKVYLVTGSDKSKTIEQVGPVIYNRCKGAYQCSGNQFWVKETLMKTSDWTLPNLARTFLISCEYESPFTLRTGNHIEERPGMVNFSIVGRNADSIERAKYVAYDTKENERIKIANAFNTMFPDLQATVGGETGLDIAPKGLDKGQIVKDFSKDTKIKFYGDAMWKGGNDYSLKLALEEHNFDYAECIPVADWQETWDKLKLLKKEQGNKIRD